LAEIDKSNDENLKAAVQLILQNNKIHENKTIESPRSTTTNNSFDSIETIESTGSTGSGQAGISNFGSRAMDCFWSKWNVYCVHRVTRDDLSQEIEV
jgi:hypothetical protein